MYRSQARKKTCALSLVVLVFFSLSFSFHVYRCLPYSRSFFRGGQKVSGRKPRDYHHLSSRPSTVPPSLTLLRKIARFVDTLPRGTARSRRTSLISSFLSRRPARGHRPTPTECQVSDKRYNFLRALLSFFLHRLFFLTPLLSVSFCRFACLTSPLYL